MAVSNKSKILRPASFSLPKRARKSGIIFILLYIYLHSNEPCSISTPSTRTPHWLTGVSRKFHEGKQAWNYGEDHVISPSFRTTQSPTSICFFHLRIHPFPLNNLSSSSMSDWDNVTIIGQKARVGGGGPREKVARTQAEINAARRSGAAINTEKKYGSTNTKSNPEGQRLTKLDNTDDVVSVKKVDVSVGKTISQARQEKKLTQKDLATKVNEKPQVINDYEAGRAVPNQQVLAKIERALGVKLRGKNIGEPLFGPKKK
ncbi:hypothetical protein CA7LBN_000970 [Candidozyma auris]|uniref:HTH cro/C1-type domain-containing protein n=3 Tax=Candidozyma auris TaxID=498019 RepID=A0A8F2VYI5_CANAR|nr:hypothetical protein CA7LBN_000970 [[Candida] auris]